MVVFYYGYWCDHCVSQLFGLQEDLKFFDQINARIVAISPDEPEMTRQRYQEFGKFSFTVLSDLEGEVGTRFGVTDPEVPTDPAGLKHGTFVVDPAGVVRWANVSDEPFFDNQTLLFELERSKQPMSPTSN